MSSSMLAADGYLPPPPELAEYVFNYYGWSQPANALVAPPVLRNGAAQAASGGEGGFLFLTHADTDLLALRAARELLPADFPAVRALSLGKIATEQHLAAALACPGAAERVIVVRLLGGLQSVPGFRGLAESARAADSTCWSSAAPAAPTRS